VRATQQGASAGSRLGAVLIKRGLRAADLVEQWDPSGDGEIDEAEFVANCLELGVTSSAEQLAGLFRTLDESGDGALDKFEMRAALRVLEDEAYAAREVGLHQSKRLIELAGLMEAAQAEWAEARGSDPSAGGAAEPEEGLSPARPKREGVASAGEGPSGL
jgi:hypothetical protein